MWWRLEVERNHAVAPSPTSMQGLQLAGIGHWHCSGAQRPKKSEIGMRNTPECAEAETGILLYYVVHQVLVCQFICFTTPYCLLKRDLFISNATPSSASRLLM